MRVTIAAFESFSAPYMQRALVEILLLAVLAGTLGAWIVLRRLAFFTHSVGTAAFPGLVVAGPWGIAPQLAALGAALGFAGARERLARDGDEDAATGILLVGALALGALLVSVVLVVPAATVRLLARDLRELQLGTGALAAVEGVVALWLADAVNVSPGPAMALVGGAVFAVVALVSR